LHLYVKRKHVATWLMVACKGFSIRFNETRLCGGVKSSLQSLVIYYAAIPFNEKSEVCPFLVRYVHFLIISFTMQTPAELRYSLYNAFIRGGGHRVRPWWRHAPISQTRQVHGYFPCRCESSAGG